MDIGTCCVNTTVRKYQFVFQLEISQFGINHSIRQFCYIYTCRTNIKIKVIEDGYTSLIYYAVNKAFGYDIQIIVKCLKLIHY